MAKQALVAIIIGSDSDLEIMKEGALILKEFGISYEMKILSAHRSPKETGIFAETAKDSGIKVIIAGAGGAAHLAGVIASLTTLPVIGVPIDTKYLKGLDSLLSTEQMPGGVPVAAMAIGKAGSKNAALFAAEILALAESKIYKKLLTYKRSLRNSIKNKNLRIKKK